MKANYTLQAAKGLKKSYDNAQSNKINQYKDSGLFDFANTTEWDESFTSTEGLSGSKELSELETPPTLKLNDGRSITVSKRRFGGSILVSEEDQMKMGDSTTKVNEYLIKQRNQLLRDSTNDFLVNIHLMYNEAFSSSSDYLAPDSVEICGQHITSSATGGGSWFKNSTTAALSTTAVDAMETYAGDHASPEDKPDPISFDTIVVKKGSDAHRTALKLFANNISPTAINDINLYEGLYKIIATPYITTANKDYWFGLDSTRENPLSVRIRKMPAMNAPQVESNQAVRSNVTGFYEFACINAPFAMYGSNGTT